MSDDEDVTDLVSYRLTIRLASKLALQQVHSFVPQPTQGLCYQFRIRLIHALDLQGDNPTVLVSPTLYFDPDEHR
ncbi:MAG: hypothetical protein EBQ78_05260 [Betaproteobacteria bacterium]|nr:hypothetical protein [Betaproteobacteria bacterium]